MIRLYTLLLYLFSFGAFSQTKTMNRTKQSHTKTELIDQASKIINASYPEFTLDPQTYKITVWSNSEKPIVHYRRIIKFTPLNKKSFI